MLVVAAILTLAVVDSKRQGWVLRVVRHICYDVGDVFVVVVVAVFVSCRPCHCPCCPCCSRLGLADDRPNLGFYG